MEVAPMRAHPAKIILDQLSIAFGERMVVQDVSVAPQVAQHGTL
jgi:hypothetical protein